MRKKQFHYVYKLTHKTTKEFYIGMHSTYNLDDGYKGSMTTWRVDKEDLIKEVVSFHDSRSELKYAEAKLINETYNDSLNRNYHRPLKSIVETNSIEGFIQQENKLRGIREAERNKLNKAEEDEYKKRIERENLEWEQEKIQEEEFNKVVENKKISGGDFEVYLENDKVYSAFKNLQNQLKEINLDFTLEYIKQYRLINFFNTNCDTDCEIRTWLEARFKDRGVDISYIDFLYNLSYDYYSFKYKSKIYCCKYIYNESCLGGIPHLKILEKAICHIEGGNFTPRIHTGKYYSLEEFENTIEIDKDKQSAELISVNTFGLKYFVVYNK